MQYADMKDMDSFSPDRLRAKRSRRRRKGDNDADTILLAAVMLGMIVVGCTMGVAADFAERWYVGARATSSVATRDGTPARVVEGAAGSAAAAAAAGGERREAPLKGPSDAEIRYATERAVASRYNSQTAYKTRAALGELTVVDRKRRDDAWVIGVDMTVREVADNPNDDPRPRGFRHKHLLGAPKEPQPMTLNVVWSGYNWSVANMNN